MTKKIVYIDMDNVLVNFQSGIDRLDTAARNAYEGRYDETPGIFGLMDPEKDAIESFHALAKKYDTYILSTSPWKNPSAWHDKLVWVHKHLGSENGTPAYKRLILSHHKHLNQGDYLIDDRPGHNGADKFKGELIHFKSEKFPDWKAVNAYLLSE
jgi:5'-nucleotidase